MSVTPLADAPPPAATTLAEGGSSTGAMAGAAGGVGVLALLVGVWVWWRCRRPSEDSTSPADATSWPEDPEKGGNSILLGEAAVLGGCWPPNPRPVLLAAHPLGGRHLLLNYILETHTLNPGPQTPNPNPQTPHPTPHTPHPTPHTPHPTPRTPHPTPHTAGACWRARSWAPCRKARWQSLILKP